MVSAEVMGRTEILECGMGAGGGQRPYIQSLRWGREGKLHRHHQNDSALVWAAAISGEVLGRGLKVYPTLTITTRIILHQDEQRCKPFKCFINCGGQSRKTVY